MLVLVFWHSLEKRPCKHFYWFQSKGNPWKIFKNTLSFCVYVQHTTAIGLLEFFTWYYVGWLWLQIKDLEKENVDDKESETQKESSKDTKEKDKDKEKPATISMSQYQAFLR